MFEAEKDKDFAVGHVVSQSAQFAPFTHDYLYLNDSGQWTNFDATRTRANTYRGSAVQQSISGLTRTPTDMFQGSGGNFKKFGGCFFLFLFFVLFYFFFFRLDSRLLFDLIWC